MKKIFLALTTSLLFFLPVKADTNINSIFEGNKSAKIEIIVFESLTCSHCASFHTEIYPKLKEDFIDKENFADAEKKYVEALTLDDKSYQAYQGLGQLYLLQKDYEHAKETFEFLLKLNQEDPFIYRSLGEIAAGRGD